MPLRPLRGANRSPRAQKRRPFTRLLTVCALMITGATATGQAPVSANGCIASASDISNVPANYGGGSGTVASPYLISSAAQLLKLSTTSASADWDKHFRQTAEIVLTGCTWNPIGSYPPATNGTPGFTGSFDGGGFAITGLMLDLPTDRFVGMFGYTAGATLSAVNLTGTVTGGYNYVGGLVGWAEGGLIEGNSVDVDVTSRYDGAHCDRPPANQGCYGTGGLVGSLTGTVIVDSSASGAVTGYEDVGGLVGSLAGDVRISGSHATGNVSGSAYSIGGLVGYGYNAGVIEDSHASGNVESADGYYVGGLIGYISFDDGDGDDLLIDSTYATGEASSADGYVGGLIGYCDGATVSASSASGPVTETNTDGYAEGYLGGLIGKNYCMITGSHATGHVTSTSTYGENYGGLVGYFDPYEGQLIEDSYATGDITAKGLKVGGLVGENYAPISNSYAEGDVTGSAGSVGGLIGFHQNYYGDGDIIDSHAAGNVTATGDNAGGLIGHLKRRASLPTEVNGATASGAVTSTGNYVGGLIGRIEEDGVGSMITITDSSATGAVQGLEYNLGGLIGWVNGGHLRITDSFASGAVTGTAQYPVGIGGLIGLTGYSWDATTTVNIERSFASGPVAGWGAVGGLIGDMGFRNTATISASFASGDVDADVQGGGLIGKISAPGTSTSTGHLIAQDVYALGDVSVSGRAAAGLIGDAFGMYVTVSATNAYSSGSVSGQSEVGGAIGDGTPQSADGYTWNFTNVFYATGSAFTRVDYGVDKTLDELMMFETFDVLEEPDWSITDGELDPAKTWSICTGVTTPFLMWQAYLADDHPGAVPCGLAGGELPPPPPPPGSGGIPQPSRIGGSTRVDTAVAVSQEFFGAGVPVVYLATAATFADALVAGPAAGFGRGPVLLTQRDAVPAVTLAELRRLDPARIVVVGGTSVISTAVFASLAGEAPSVVRIGGDDRYETAALLSRDATTPPVPVAYVATGEDFADAVSGGPASGLDGAPILLVQQGSIPAATAAELVRLDPDRIVVLGLTNAVSAAVEAQLAAYAPVVQRIGGVDRYGTSAALSASKYLPGVSVAFLATGTGFADALTAVPAATITGGPVLLSRPHCVPQSVLAELQRLRPGRLIVLGGESATSTAVTNLTACPT